MCCLVHTRAVADPIFQSVLSNPGLIVPVTETVWKMVDRVLEEYLPRDKEEASTTVVEDYVSIEPLPSSATMASKVLSDYVLDEKPRHSGRRVAYPVSTVAKMQYQNQKDAIWYLTLGQTILPTAGAAAAVIRAINTVTDVVVCQNSRKLSSSRLAHPNGPLHATAALAFLKVLLLQWRCGKPSGKMTQQLQLQMLNGSDTTIILAIFLALQIGKATNRTHEGESMWLFLI